MFLPVGRIDINKCESLRISVCIDEGEGELVAVFVFPTFGDFDARRDRGITVVADGDDFVCGLARKPVGWRNERFDHGCFGYGRMKDVREECAVTIKCNRGADKKKEQGAKNSDKFSIHENTELFHLFVLAYLYDSILA